MTHHRSAGRRRFAVLATCAVAATSFTVATGAGVASAAPNTYRTVSVTADGSGYLLTNTGGGTYAFGSVRYRGNPAGFSGDIVGVSATADGAGYAAISSRGQVYAYGTVTYRGNPTGFSGDIAGISVTADGSGYAAISSTGQVYAYGSVQYRGNPVGYSGRIVGVSATANGSGYAAISSTGQVYAYGTVTYRGNPTGFTNGIAGISVTGNGSGYAAVSGIGQVYAYGTVTYRGNADPGSSSEAGMRATIVAKAQAEAANSAHNREIGGTNCNFYTPSGEGHSCTNGWRGQAWCADFARWIWGQSGARTAGLSAGAVSFKNKGAWHPGKNLTGIQAGDVVGWRFESGTSEDDHVGVVVAVNGNSITTIDGNYGDAVKSHPFTRGNAELSGYATATR